LTAVAIQTCSRSRHDALDQNNCRMLDKTRRSSTHGTPRDVFGGIGLIATHRPSSNRRLLSG